MDAGRVAVPSDELLIYHQEIEHIVEVVFDILLFYIVSHDEVEEVFGDGFDECRFVHGCVILFGEE